MDRSVTFKLIGTNWTQDSIGQWIETEVQRDVFGQISSVTANEFFAAGQNGISPEFRITMFCADYNGERDLIMNDQVYSIYRTYQTRNDKLELYVEKRRGDGNRGLA